MIPKELIEKQRKAEDAVNRTHDRLEKAQKEFDVAKEELRKIQIEIGAILDGHPASNEAGSGTF